MGLSFCETHRSCHERKMMGIAALNPSYGLGKKTTETKFELPPQDAEAFVARIQSNKPGFARP